MSEKNRNNKQSKNDNSDNSLFLWLLVVPTEVKTCYFTRLAKSESLHACNVLRGFPSWFWTFKFNETSYITMISLIFCIFKKLTSDLVRCIYLVRRFVWIFCIEYLCMFVDIGVHCISWVHSTNSRSHWSINSLSLLSQQLRQFTSRSSCYRN